MNNMDSLFPLHLKCFCGNIRKKIGVRYFFLKTPAKIAKVTASVPTTVNTVPLAVHSIIGIPSVSSGVKNPKQIIQFVDLA